MQRKTLLTFVFFLVAFTAAAEELRFVTPLDRSQVFGPTRLEVATSQKSVDRVEFYVDDSLAGVSRKAPFGMMYDFGESISSHRIAARVFAHGYAIREDAQIVTAPLSASGEIAVDLVEVPLRISGPARVRPSDIELLENGATQKILEIRPERGPTRFVFVVDRSLSMGSGKLTASLRAIDSIQPQLRAGDDAEILFFNHQVSQPLPIQASLRGKPPVPSGGTSLRDAVASLQPVRRTIAVVISDGGTAPLRHRRANRYGGSVRQTSPFMPSSWVRAAPAPFSNRLHGIPEAVQSRPPCLIWNATSTGSLPTSTEGLRWSIRAVPSKEDGEASTSSRAHPR